MSLATTSLTLRALLQTVASRTALAAPASAISGLSPEARALALAAVAGDTPVLAVVPSDVDVKCLTADVRFFYKALHSTTEFEVLRSVLPFPSPEIDPYRAIAPHLDVASARARALTAISHRTAHIVIASASALLPRVSSPDRVRHASRELVVGGLVSPTELGDLLADAGFMPEDPVDEHGEFCVRGGVVDFFPVGDEYPVRVEFVGDLIEGLRCYDPGTQRSIESLDRATVIPLREVFESVSSDDRDPNRWQLVRDASVLDYMASLPRLRVFVIEADECAERADKVMSQVSASYAEATTRGESAPMPEQLLIDWEALRPLLGGATRLNTLSIEEGAAPTAATRHVACQPTIAFHGRLGAWVEEVRHGRDRGETQLVVVATPGRAERIIELLGEHGLVAVSIDHAEHTHAAALLVTTGQLSRGFRLPDAAFQIHAENDLFDEERRGPDPRRSVGQAFLSDLRDLKIGDHVVHVEHGLAKFIGMSRLAVGQTLQEFMELQYSGNDKLFVPVEHFDLIQKHTGTVHQALDRLGGATWERVKTRVRRAMRDMAEELLKLYAARKAKPGHAFGPDTHWQEEFDAAFEHELTPDQQTAINDIKRDMEEPTPMDRLLCGDVGYGKTEVALRAAFKAVIDGKQVALLAPTTVLAFQHFTTLTERFAAFPIRIEMLSRFRTRSAQKQILTDLTSGKIEILVGTHRLLSKDVRFNDLGLLVVDEEQRFGVAHKERIKRLRHKVDVLTLTATPIPRTLSMSLGGICDMSIIETPPKDRLSIQTNVVKFDVQIIARAIRTELERKGQVYFVHNQISSIYGIGDLIRRLVPEARVAVAHGQSSEVALERTMLDFMAHEYDVLLSTTIIENGLDIPNVNTIIVNHAERYGLAQLYQLRGRVGRSDRHAYAYLLVPPEDTLSRVARQRLTAIKEFSELGSGFRVAALDLEIRGAGNLLGGEQSGHIEAIGFDMYVKLLDQTVRQLRGEQISEERRAVVNLGITLRIDQNYIPETNQRLAVYREVMAAANEDQLVVILDDLRDRYGPLSRGVICLAEYGRIRLLADRLGVESIDRERHLLVVKFRREAPLDPKRLIDFVGRQVDVTLTPPGVLRVNLEARGDEAPAGLQARSRLRLESTSWWTQRATASHVTPGFSKQEVLNPDLVGGEEKVLARVGRILAELSDKD